MHVLKKILYVPSVIMLASALLKIETAIVYSLTLKKRCKPGKKPKEALVK
jgi:hypothetical protein